MKKGAVVVSKLKKKLRQDLNALSKVGNSINLLASIE
jgi:hypothetical protein